MRENLSPEQRFLLTRLALLYARTPDEEEELSDKRADELFDAANRLGFGDLGTQILDWAEKAIYDPSSLEQHMLRDISTHAALLARLNLKGRSVFEIGAGTGVLTKLILDAGVTRLDAYEIEPGLCKVSHPNLHLWEVDVREAFPILSVKPGLAMAIISNPPYDLLTFIRTWVEKHKIADVILLIPEKALDLYAEYTVEATLPGTAFEPVSKGNHLLIRKGFAT